MERRLPTPLNEEVSHRDHNSFELSLQHDDIEISGIIDVIGSHIPFCALNYYDGPSCRAAEVCNKSEKTHGDQDGMFLEVGPVQGVAWVT